MIKTDAFNPNKTWRLERTADGNNYNLGQFVLGNVTGYVPNVTAQHILDFSPFTKREIRQVNRYALLGDIMRLAWEIKREHKDNIFGECLRYAWMIAR